LSVPQYVTFELCGPVCAVGDWPNYAVATGVTVPEAAVNENYLFARGKDNIRLSGQGLRMECVSVAH